MLIKALKSTLHFFKQHFCENPSKFANLADFVSQKKRRYFLEYFSRWKYREKKTSDFWYANFDPLDLFFFLPFFLLLFIGTRVKACYFLDLQKLLQRQGKKGFAVNPKPQLTSAKFLNILRHTRSDGHFSIMYLA